MAKIRLPKGWKKRVRSATLHVISLAPCTTIDMWGWAPSIISHVVLWLLASLPSGLTVVACAPAWDEPFIVWEQPRNTSFAIARASSTVMYFDAGPNAKASSRHVMARSASTAASQWWSD